MNFIETKFKDVYVIDPEKLEDDRGFFARTWCRREFSKRRLNSELAQCNMSFNRRRGTLRGMHYQIAPHEEAKLIRCTRGSIYNVVIDIRHDSATFTEWLAVELSAENRRMLYVGEGFANGFQTLEDNTEVHYQMSEFYVPESARGIRWNDPAFAIRWPDGRQILSDRDKSFPDYHR
jgi:dTDP-4-dehydrorhamnose 3,5-epimerase